MLLSWAPWKGDLIKNKLDISKILLLISHVLFLKKLHSNTQEIRCNFLWKIIFQKLTLNFNGIFLATDEGLKITETSQPALSLSWPTMNKHSLFWPSMNSSPTNHVGFQSTIKTRQTYVPCGSIMASLIFQNLYLLHRITSYTLLSNLNLHLTFWTLHELRGKAAQTLDSVNRHIHQLRGRKSLFNHTP